MPCVTFVPPVVRRPSNVFEICWRDSAVNVVGVDEGGGGFRRRVGAVESWGEWVDPLGYEPIQLRAAAPQELVSALWHGILRRGVGTDAQRTLG